MGLNKINRKITFKITKEDGKYQEDNEKCSLEGPRCCFYFDTSYNRFVALIFIFFTSFFYLANLDMPASMENEIEKTFSVLPYKYEYMYSFYSIPTIVMCLFNGVLIDRVFGLLHGSIIFGVIAIVGQVVITIGGFVKVYWLMLVGRFINGIGAETICTCFNCYSVLWFKDKELNFVFSLIVTATRLGSSFVFIFSPPLYKQVREVFPENLVFGISTTPFMGITIAMSTSMILLGYFSRWNNKLVCKSKNSEDFINYKQILEFRLSFWLIIVMLVSSFNGAFGFITISQQLLHTKYNISNEEASSLSSAFSLVTAFLCLIPGVLADAVGRDLYIVLFGLSSGALSQIIMCATSWNCWIPLILYSTYFSIINSTLLALMSKVAEPYQMATAYGLFLSLFNLVSTGYNVLIGYALEKYGATGVSLLFLGSALVSIVCCFILLFLDRHQKGTLNSSIAQRKAIKI